MSTLTTIQTSGPDRLIHLEIPVLKAGEPYRIIVRVEEQPKASASENGWPDSYYESVAGAWQGEFPCVREGEFETRETL